MDAIFAAPLRGGDAVWPEQWKDETLFEPARRRLIYHGIAGLLHERRPLLIEWPRVLIETISEECLARTMWELRHRDLLSKVLENLHEASVASVILKGTALAYSVYDNPSHRIRGDTDLLISEADLPVSRQIFMELGWSIAVNTCGPFGNMHYQEIWQFEDQAGFSHDIDLHWEVTNSRALRRVLDVSVVLSDAVPLPALSRHARCVDPVAALIHGCINRAEHKRTGYFSIDRNEFDPNRLLWAYDFHLQAAKFTSRQWNTYLERSAATGVAAICTDALEFARISLGTIFPKAVSSQFECVPLETTATRYLGSANELERAWADLKATPGVRAKLRFVLARAFPAGKFMREKYTELEHFPLPFLYMRRMISGFAKLFQRRAQV